MGSSRGVILAWLHVLILASALAGQSPAASDAEAPKDTAVSSTADDGKPSDKADEKPANKPDGETGKAKESSKESTVTKKSSTASRPAAPKSSAGPRVLTRSEMKKPRSPFLEAPGSEGVAPDRYAPGAVDWSEIPPWRQTSFFGIRAPGKFFVYVIDCSESMIDEDRFARATMEVRRSVLALQAPQQFEIIFYNDESIPMPGGPRPRSADTQNKSQMISWLRLIEPISGTDPREAIRQALGLRPEAVFLLSDGAFPDGTTEIVAKFNGKKIPIHCVDLSGGEGGDHLRRIAKDSGGQYASRPGNLQGKR
jgi:von Willebrand factor type A domain